jgi:uncharacterized protein YndB with AHSA1/START domain
VIDIINELAAVQRRVGTRRIPAGEGRTVLLRRSYDAPVEDVWDAITNPERINRWFLPVTGDLRVGGRYQLTGNAGGEILRCEAPRLLRVTWVFGEDPGEADITEVEVRLSAGSPGETVLELEHAAVVGPERWSEYGPGAVGVGWDCVLLGLGRHLAGGEISDAERAEWGTTPEARRFMTESSTAWGAALAETGATATDVTRAVTNTTAFYVPEPIRPGS